jgi:hypothetical protein
MKDNSTPNLVKKMKLSRALGICPTKKIEIKLWSNFVMDEEAFHVPKKDFSKLYVCGVCVQLCNPIDMPHDIPRRSPTMSSSYNLFLKLEIW